jgi:hypothetical protein
MTAHGGSLNTGEIPLWSVLHPIVDFADAEESHLVEFEVDPS